MSDIKVVTNHVPRDVIDASELTAAERNEFDYHNWEAMEEGRDSASFFRYKGQLYDLSQFSVDAGITKGCGLPAHLSRWDVYQSQHAFCAIVVRFIDDEQVIVGRVLS
jgi:hypothetical protein